MGKCAAVLLDVDGTLLLSNDAHARAWCNAFEEFGYTVRLEQVRRLIGMGGEKLLAAVAPDLTEDRDPGRAIAERRKDLFLHRYLPGVQAAPGARELVERFREDGLARTVATSAGADELNALLRAAHIEDLIENTATSDDAAHSKPDPDIVQAALRRSGVGAAEAVMLGDTPYDIEAAARAGVAMVAVRCGGWTDTDLGGALAIYDDPADLLRNYRTSPFFARA